MKKLQKKAQNRNTADASEERALKQAQRLQSAGLPMLKSWLTVGDDRVCELCAGNEAVGWIPVDDAFPSGHMHPLAHNCCRCCLLTRMKMEGR